MGAGYFKGDSGENRLKEKLDESIDINVLRRSR
jgi:hypothetical protein